MGQSMAVSTLLRRVGRLLTNPSEGDQLVFIGKGDRKPPKQVDMGNSGFNVLATNADPVESLMTLEGLPSNLLNPTARDRTSPYTCTGPKILIDATRGSTMGRPERREEMERIGFWPGIALKDFL